MRNILKFQSFHFSYSTYRRITRTYFCLHSYANSWIIILWCGILNHKMVALYSETKLGVTQESTNQARIICLFCICRCSGGPEIHWHLQLIHMACSTHGKTKDAFGPSPSRPTQPLHTGQGQSRLSRSSQKDTSNSPATPRHSVLLPSLHFHASTRSGLSLLLAQFSLNSWGTHN